MTEKRKMMVGKHPMSPFGNTEAVFDDDYWEQRAKRLQAEVARLTAALEQQAAEVARLRTLLEQLAEPNDFLSHIEIRRRVRAALAAPPAADGGGAARE